MLEVLTCKMGWYIYLKDILRPTKWNQVCQCTLQMVKCFKNQGICKDITAWYGKALSWKPEKQGLTLQSSKGKQKWMRTNETDQPTRMCGPDLDSDSNR